MAKYNLGCGPYPIHEQHLEIMGDMKDWVLVDKYIQDKGIMNWDAEILDEIPDGTADTIYASHLLEHIPHTRIEETLELWKRKLKSGGELILNVPDMSWVAEQIRKFENYQILDSSSYPDFEGNNGLQSVIYGTHDHGGEIHHSGFTPRSMKELLENLIMDDIKVERLYEAHDMGCIIARAKKP